MHLVVAAQRGARGVEEERGVEVLRAVGGAGREHLTVETHEPAGPVASCVGGQQVEPLGFEHAAAAGLPLGGGG